MFEDSGLLTPPVFMKIFTMLHDGVLIVDSNGVIQAINPAVTGLLGYQPDDLCGTPFTDLRHHVSHLNEHLREHVAFFGFFFFCQAEKRPIPMVLRHKTGRGIPVQLRSVIVRNASGGIQEALGIIEKMAVNDQNNVLDTEDALNKRVWEIEQNYRNIFENTGDAIFILDFNTIIIAVNKAALEMLQCESADELVGKSMTELGPYSGTFLSTTGERVSIRTKAREEKLSVADELFGRGRAYTEFYLLRKDNVVVPIKATMSQLTSKNGELRGVITICRDITDHQLNEINLRRARNGFEKKVKERTANLEEVNTALRVLVKGREEDRIQLEQKILSNVNQLVVPYLEQCERSGLDGKQKSYLNIAVTNLQNIIAPFAHKLSTGFLRLTPTEIKVANLVKQGRTTKQIAQVLNLSAETVETHRKKIRKKLGLQNRKTNLHSYLLSLD